MVDREQSKEIQGFGARVSDLGKEEGRGKKKNMRNDPKSRF